jgi:hypothetical protein
MISRFMVLLLVVDGLQLGRQFGGGWGEENGCGSQAEAGLHDPDMVVSPKWSVIGGERHQHAHTNGAAELGTHVQRWRCGRGSTNWERASGAYIGARRAAGVPNGDHRREHLGPVGELRMDAAALIKRKMMA